MCKQSPALQAAAHGALHEEFTNAIHPAKAGRGPGLEDKAGPVPMKSTAVLNTVSLLQQMWAANVGWKHHFIRGASGDYIHMKARLLITHTHALMLGGAHLTPGAPHRLGSSTRFSPRVCPTEGAAAAPLKCRVLPTP